MEEAHHRVKAYGKGVKVLTVAVTDSDGATTLYVHGDLNEAQKRLVEYGELGSGVKLRFVEIPGSLKRHMHQQPTSCTCEECGEELDITCRSDDEENLIIMVPKCDCGDENGNASL